MKSQQNPTPIAIDGEKKTYGKISGFWRKLLESERFVTLIACLFLGTGLSLALIALTELEFSFARGFALSLVAAAVVAMVCFRWWIPVSLFGVVLLSVASFHLYHDSIPEWLDYWSGFISWSLSGAFFHDTYSEGFSAYLLQFLVILLIISILYPLAKRPVLFPVLFVLATGILIFSYIRSPGDRAAAISACCSGAIILLPGIYARVVRKKTHADKSISTQLQMVAIPAAIFAVLFAFWVTPENTRHWRSTALVHLAEDIGALIGGPLNRLPTSASNFSMYDFGFQAQRDRLGGPVNLSSDTILLVDSPVNVLLKGRVFDTYTGSNWEIGAQDGDLRFESFFWRRLRTEALGLDRPIGRGRTQELYNAMTREIDITVTYRTDVFLTLFNTGKIQNLTFSSQRIYPSAYFNMRSEIYMRNLIPTGHRVHLQTRIWHTSRADFDSMFLELEALAMNETDPRYEALRERYTALPDDLPDSVREITSQVTAGDETPYSKVMSIVVWLNENFEYSLEPEIVPEGEDFVDYFFKTGVGYCTYFASALAVMARIEGIPSRYVTGFSLDRHEDRDGFVATGETAHAWTELYFSGIGWVEIDPLRHNPAVSGNWGTAAEQEIDQPQESPPPPGQLPQDQEDVALTDDAADGRRFNASYLIIIIPVIFITVIVLPPVSINVLLKRKSRQFALNKICIRKNSVFRRLEIYHLDIIKQLSLLDLAPLPGETLFTFPARVDDRIALKDVRFSPIASNIAAYHFAGIEPTHEHVEEAYEYHHLLEQHLFECLGKWMYLFKRALR